MGKAGGKAARGLISWDITIIRMRNTIGHDQLVSSFSRQDKILLYKTQEQFKLYFLIILSL